MWTLCNGPDKWIIPPFSHNDFYSLYQNGSSIMPDVIFLFHRGFQCSRQNWPFPTYNKSEADKFEICAKKYRNSF